MASEAPAPEVTRVASAPPQPPSRQPPQKASGRGFNPLRAFSPMVNLIRNGNAEKTPRAPSQPSSASAPNLPVVAKPPPTPPPARNSSRSRPTPRKSSTPREASPQLPAVGPNASPRRPGLNTPRESPTPDVCDSPVPRGAREIRAPTSVVARSAPAAPGAPPGAPTNSVAGGGHDGQLNGQCRELLQVQGNAMKLLAEVFEFPVTEEASVSIMDQYPELAWLAHCMQRCPLPPCWTSVDGPSPENPNGEARYIDMESGEMTEVQPMLKNFGEMARLMLEWRQSPSAAPYVSTELLARHDNATEEAARSRRVWSGPHTDQSTSMKFWHCEATGRSTWGDPGASSEFIARVAERLRRALPQNTEPEAPAAAEVAPAQPESKMESKMNASIKKASELKQSPRPPTPQKAPASPDVRPNTPQHARPKTPARPSTPADVVSAAEAAGTPSNKLGDTGELIKSRADEVRQMMAQIRQNAEAATTRAGETLSQTQSLKQDLSSTRSDVIRGGDVSSLPSPARASPRVPSAPTSRGPSPSPPPRRAAPSPRSLASARGMRIPQDANLMEWGVAGNRIYQEAAAEVRAPKVGAFKPGSCRPAGGVARRRVDSTERLEPLGTPKKKVTLLSKDGVTILHPGADAATEKVLFFDGSGAAGVGAPPDANEIAEASKSTMPPRCCTPARPRTRRGDSDELESPPRPNTPAVTTPGTPKPTSRVPGTPRPRTPGVPSKKKKGSFDAQDDVVVASPGRTDRISEGGSSAGDSSSSDEAEVVEMACDSPLGNTGAAKELCSMAIAAAVNVALGAESGAGADAPTAATAVALSKSAEAITDAGAAANAASGSLESAASSSSPRNLATTANFGNTSNTVGNLGNTAAARQLCDDAIEAALGGAVHALNFNGTNGSINDLGGSMMMTAGTACGTMGATAGSVMRATAGTVVGGPMAVTLGVTLGATGDVPPIHPGEDLNTSQDENLLEGPGDLSPPSTPQPQKTTTALLRAALAAEESDEEREPLSPTLMSICNAWSPSPTKRDLNVSMGNSPSIILLDTSLHFTPCKAIPRSVSPPPAPVSLARSESAERVMSRPLSPCSPRPNSSRRKEKKERPIRCRSPEPISARGRERHAQEMAALGLPGDGSRSARGPRSARGLKGPSSRPVGIGAVAGGA